MKRKTASESENNKLLGHVYSDKWYEGQVDDSLKSAIEVIPRLWDIFKPNVVADVGCGRGAWLKTWLDNGTQHAIGYDGSWNNKNKMIDSRIEFIATDLNSPITCNYKVDLVCSLEVAEHLHPSSALSFVESLTSMSDVVLFSAAFTNQGGQNHINEKPHSYWMQIFHDLDYETYDLIRPYFWNNRNVCWWYSQNAFVYVKKGSIYNSKLNELDYTPLDKYSLRDAIHPEMYELIFKNYKNILNSRSYKIAKFISNIL